MTRHRERRGLVLRQGIDQLTQVTRNKERLQKDPSRLNVWANLGEGPEIVEFLEFSSGGIKVRKNSDTFLVFLRNDVDNVDDLSPRQALIYKGTQPGRRLRFYSTPTTAPMALISRNCDSVNSWFSANHLCDEIHLMSDESTKADYEEQVYFWNNLGNSENVKFINDGRATDSSYSGNYNEVIPPVRNENGLALGGNNILWTEQPGLIETGKRLSVLNVDMTIGLEGVNENFGTKPVFFYAGDETTQSANFEVGLFESSTTGDLVFTLAIIENDGNSINSQQINYDAIDIPVSERDDIDVGVTLNINHDVASVDAVVVVNGTELTTEDSFSNNYSMFEFFSENFSDVISLGNRSIIDNGSLVTALDFDDNNGVNFQLKSVDIDFEKVDYEDSTTCAEYITPMFWKRADWLSHTTWDAENEVWFADENESDLAIMTEESFSQNILDDTFIETISVTYEYFMPEETEIMFGLYGVNSTSDFVSLFPEVVFPSGAGEKTIEYDVNSSYSHSGDGGFYLDAYSQGQGLLIKNVEICIDENGGDGGGGDEEDNGVR